MWPRGGASGRPCGALTLAPRRLRSRGTRTDGHAPPNRSLARTRGQAHARNARDAREEAAPGSRLRYADEQPPPKRRERRAGHRQARGAALRALHSPPRLPTRPRGGGEAAAPALLDGEEEDGEEAEAASGGTRPSSERHRRAPGAGSGPERLSLKKAGGPSDPASYLRKSSPREQRPRRVRAGAGGRPPISGARAAHAGSARFPRLGERISRRPRPRLQGDAACVRDAAPGTREFAQPQCVRRHAPPSGSLALSGRTWVDPAVVGLGWVGGASFCNPPIKIIPG